MLGFLSRFVDSNDRELRRIQPLVDQANELEPEMQARSDAEIRAAMDEIRAEILDAGEPEEPSEDERHHPDLEHRRELKKDRLKREYDRLQAAMDEALPEIFAAAREAMRRTLDMRHFDVQLLGGVVLHQGRVAEMKTGEGKTFVPTLAAVLNAMTGRGVHVVTVNDYLARRDAQWMGPVYKFLGLSVGIIAHDTSYIFEPGYPTSDERLINLRPCTRQEAYAADITYGTNNEFGFDYLRDNMVVELDQRVQRERFFAIVDEVDNILIDEARTPLIISGQAEESADKYFLFARLVPRLVGREEGDEEGGDYFIDLKEKAVSPTEQGISKMEKLLGVKNLYDDPTAGALLRVGPEGSRPVPARPRLHRQGRRDRHRRRIHRPPDAGPPLERGPAPGHRSQGGPARPARERHPGDDHFPELLPPLHQAGRHDRHGHDRGRRAAQDLQAGGRGHPHPPADDPRRRAGPTSSATRPASTWPSSTRSWRCTTPGGRSWWAPSRSRSPSGWPTCSSAGASSTKSSTPSSTRRKPRSWPRPDASAQ